MVSLVEQELNGVNHLLYFSSSSSQGSATQTVTFQPGTDPELAKVDIQNRLKVVEPRLPRAVTQQGIQIEETSAGYLLFVTLTATRRAPRHHRPERLPGAQRGQRTAPAGRGGQGPAVWRRARPARLARPQSPGGGRPDPADVTRAIAEQNVQVAAGSLGELPTPAGQELNAPVLIKGQLSDPAEFAGILLRAGADAPA